MEEYYFDVFMKSDKPFLLLFVILFLYFIRTTKERETKYLKSMQQDLRVMMKVWKILLEKELTHKKEAKKDEH